MTIVLKSARFIFLKIPAAIIFVVLYVIKKTFEFLSGIVAILCRIVSSIVFLISFLVVILGLATINEMIWPAVGAVIVFSLTLLRSCIMHMIEFIVLGIKAFLVKG